MRQMKLRTWALLILLLGSVCVAGWVAWSRPQRVDMASYAPADALLYLEANDPLAVIEAVSKTEALKVLGTANTAWGTYPKSWSRWFLRNSGIGPAQSVILSRAQVAVVVTNLGAVEGNDTLTIKPEIALIIETHTSSGRIKEETESALHRLAETTYGKPTFRRTQVNGMEFLEWANQEGSRRIVASISQSTVVIANSEAAVHRCLDSANGRTPSLQNNSSFQQRRREFATRDTLTFGYVPEEKSAQLLSFAVPVLLGRAPGDVSFQKLISTGAAKMFGSITWGSRAFGNGIEDRYLISLKPTLLAQLKPVLTQNPSSERLPAVPTHAYSVTYYRFNNPETAWQGLKTAISSNVDALSAVVFTTLLNSALSSYGIAEPETFLRTVRGPVLTVRLDPNSDRTMVIATVNDKNAMRQFIIKTMKYGQQEALDGVDLFLNSERDLAVGLSDDLAIMGAAADVRRYLDNSKTGGDAETVRRMSVYSPVTNLSPISTYSDDSERVRRFISTLVSAGLSQPMESDLLDRTLITLPYATTDSRIDDGGIERITRSPLGQFSSLLPLIIPERSATTSPAR